MLFANAGASWGSRFEDVDETNAWDKVMDLNVKGVFFTVQKYAFDFLTFPPTYLIQCFVKRIGTASRSVGRMAAGQTTLLGHLSVPIDAFCRDTTYCSLCHGKQYRC